MSWMVCQYSRAGPLSSEKHQGTPAIEVKGRGGLECPRAFDPDLNGLWCNAPLVLAASGVAAQRITSVAWDSSDGGRVRPSACTVFRLMTSSKAVGASMRSSPGLAPFRI